MKTINKVYLFYFVFLGACDDSNTNKITPSEGSIVFWTKRSDIYYNSPNDANIIEIKLDKIDKEAFIFSPYNSTPNCIANLTATFTFIPKGRYQFSAESTDGKKWSGTVNVSEGCSSMELL